MPKKKEAPASPFVPAEKQPYPILENWRWVKLEDISEIIMGQSPAGSDTTDDSSYMPLIGGAADMGIMYPHAIRYTKVPTKISKNGDLVLCIRATLGKPIFSDGEYCLGRGVAAIRPYTGTKEFYRYFFLNFEQYLYDNATGTTFAQVSSKTLQRMPVPLSPLPEQHRIVTRIESLFAKLDEAKEKAQAVVDGFELRKSAILHKAFTGELTARWRKEHGIGIDSWKQLSIASICHSLKYGTAKKSEKTGPVVVLRMGNLQQGEIDWSDLAYSSDKDDIEKYRLVAGDVLFNRTNSAALVGKTSIYRGEYPAIYAGYLIKLDYNHEIVTGDFLNYALNTDRAREYCNLVKTDGVNQSNINAKKIGAYMIPVPNMDEQRQIVELLQKLLTSEHQAKEAAEAVLAQINAMKKAILARAFRGELGTNDPGEESAATELLAAIQQT